MFDPKKVEKEMAVAPVSKALGMKRPKSEVAVAPASGVGGRGQRWLFCPSLVGVVGGSKRRHSAAVLLFASAEGLL